MKKPRRRAVKKKTPPARARRATIKKKPAPSRRTPRKLKPVRRISTTLDGYQKAVETLGRTRASASLKILRGLRVRSRPSERIRAHKTPPLIQYIPPRGRGKLWTKITVTGESEVPVRDKKVTAAQARRGKIAALENTWIRKVAGALDMNAADVRRWRSAAHARARRAYARSSPAQKRRVPLSRHLAIADILIKRLAGIEGS